MTSAKTTAKITLTEAVAIPFDKLVLSQANVRQIAHGQSIEDLAEDHRSSWWRHGGAEPMVCAFYGGGLDFFADPGRYLEFPPPEGCRVRRRPGDERAPSAPRRPRRIHPAGRDLVQKRGQVARIGRIWANPP